MAVLPAEAEGRAYIQYGNLRKAAAVLVGLVEQADRVPQIGPLHHVIVRKTVAGLHWARGDHPAWADWIGQARTIGHAARLTHQVAGIVRTYGAAVAPLLVEIAAPPPRPGARPNGRTYPSGRRPRWPSGSVSALSVPSR